METRAVCKITNVIHPPKTLTDLDGIKSCLSSAPFDVILYYDGAYKVQVILVIAAT